MGGDPRAGAMAGDPLAAPITGHRRAGAISAVGHTARRPRPAAVRRFALIAITVLLAASLPASAGASGPGLGRARSRQTDTPPPPALPSPELTSLQQLLDSTINGKDGQGGGLVVDEATGRTLWSFHADIPLIPASLQKLYTTSTALLKFGPNTTFDTVVAGTGKLLAHGVWDGNLYLHGGGDPTFGSASFDASLYGTGATVQALAASVKRAGIRAVRGAILGDESWFDSLRGGPASDYQPEVWTEGQLSALAYDAGFTSQQETQLQPNPPLTATRALVAALRADGVRILHGDHVGVGRAPATARMLGFVSSPPLSELLALTNQPSDNFFAETLLKDLGATFGKGGTTVDGAAVVRSFVASHFGLYPQFNDGSGLSTYDRTSPEQLVHILRVMQGNRAFWNSLPVAGVRGTMKDEMLHTRAADNCRGKTGTLTGIATMAGYCRAANGHELVFAFLLNDLHHTNKGHLREDHAAEALANYAG